MWKNYLEKLDWILLTVTGLLLSSGLATFYAMGPDSHKVFVRQAGLIGIGILVLIIISNIDYRIFKNNTIPVVGFYVVSLIALFMTLAEREIRGASSWLEFGGFRFEPSEFTKLALLILLAKYFSQKHVEISRTKHIIVSGIYVGIPTILTLLQPDLGSVIVYIVIWIVMLFAAGIQRKHLLAILMLGVIISSFGWFFALKPYQKARIVTFINPYLDSHGTGYNTIQSRITFGSGRLTGTYFSKERRDIPVFVPEPYTDFTFSTLAQKFGLIGVLSFLTFVIILFTRIGSITSNAQNNFAKLFGIGFMTIIGIHILINGGMNVGILPITGIPFPFLSHGGSHLVMLMTGLGIVQSIRLRNI